MMKSLCCNSKQKLLVALCLLFCLSGNAQQANTVNRAAAKEKVLLPIWMVNSLSG